MGKKSVGDRGQDDDDDEDEDEGGDDDCPGPGLADRQEARTPVTRARGPGQIRFTAAGGGSRRKHSCWPGEEQPDT